MIASQLHFDLTACFGHLKNRKQAVWTTLYVPKKYTNQTYIRLISKTEHQFIRA